MVKHRSYPATSRSSVGGHGSLEWEQDHQDQTNTLILKFMNRQSRGCFLKSVKSLAEVPPRDSLPRARLRDLPDRKEDGRSPSRRLTTVFSRESDSHTEAELGTVDGQCSGARARPEARVRAPRHAFQRTPRSKHFPLSDNRLSRTPGDPRTEKPERTGERHGRWQPQPATRRCLPIHTR